MFVRFWGALSAIRGAGSATELQRDSAMTASLFFNWSGATHAYTQRTFLTVRAHPTDYETART